MSGLSKNKIKWIRSLQLKKFRDELGLFIVEGEKMVIEAIELCPERIESIYFIEGTINIPKGFQHTAVSEKELDQISSLKTPNKALAVIRKHTQALLSVPPGLILALDGVQDPGNMGTILRIADWFGIENVICSENTVDCFNPKVVQSTMGAIFRVNTEYCNLSKWLRQVNKPVYGALLEGEDVYNSSLKDDAVLLMGNEGKGISDELISLISHPIMIPRFGKAESLNVSIAAGILVSEFKRR